MPDPNPPPSPQSPEVLDTGQEEVFSRTEVELGRTEHASDAGSKDKAGKPAPSAPRRAPRA